MPGFQKHERLLKRADFLRVSGQGHKFHTNNFIILWKDSSISAVRIGITVSGKVGNAVMRNRIKRAIREFYRENKGLFAPVDYNIVAKKGAAHLGSSEISQELGRAMQSLLRRQCQQS